MQPDRPRHRRFAVELAGAVGVLLLAGAAGLLVHVKDANPPSLADSTMPPRPLLTPTPLPAVPAADAAAAHIPTTALVTPFQMVAADGTDQTLIGAYADSTRLVLFFRHATAPDPRTHADMSVYDSHGFINAATQGGRSSGTDTYLALDLGPRADADGLAHITVTDTYPQASFTAPPPATGWAFRFDLRLRPTVHIAAPRTMQLNSWTVTIEDLSATPSVINFQAVVAGANNEQLYANMQSQPVVLLDSSGKEVPKISEDAGVTVPKQQLNATTYQNTRVRIQWTRPDVASTYRLQLTGNGASKSITLQIPAP